LKVAFDEHVPTALVRVFELFSNERQFKALARGVTVSSAASYAPAPDDHDYLKGRDDPWIRRFAKSGGKVIISGDTNMKRVPHERQALVDEGLIVIFFENKWAQWPFFRKCAFLLNWWLPIIDVVTTAEPGSFWRVPGKWDKPDKLARISNVDLKLEKTKRQKAARAEVAASRARKRASAPASQTDLLIDPPPPTDKAT